MGNGKWQKQLNIFLTLFPNSIVDVDRLLVRITNSEPLKKQSDLHLHSLLRTLFRQLQCVLKKRFFQIATIPV